MTTSPHPTTAAAAPPAAEAPLSVPEIPIISLPSPNAASEIFTACSTWGAFIATDHSISPALLTNVLDLGHQFFNLPLQTKQKYNLQKHGAKWRGYMPLYGERSVHGTISDQKEGLYLGENHSPTHERVLAGLPTFGTNVYPTNEEVPAMEETFEEYHGEMKKLGDRMMGMLSLGLGLEGDYMERHVTKGEPVLLPRMFRYLPQPRNEGRGEDDYRASGEDNDNGIDVKWGIGRHSDYGLWTMILTDAPGLEFQHPRLGTWHSVPCVPNGIIMNVGDVLDRLSAGRYVSAYHRARNLSDVHPRLSLPFFYDAAWDARMETLPIVAENATEDVSVKELLDTPERKERWSNTKIACSFDVEEAGTGVEYSEFLAKKVAKVFPDLIPQSLWKTLSSTSAPSTRHALTVKVPDKIYTDRVLAELETFFKSNPQIKESHGLSHAEAVHDHAVKAIACVVSPPLSAEEAMEIKIAALLHDVDDRKYFPTVVTAPALPRSGENDKENANNCREEVDRTCADKRAVTSLPNARKICAKAGISADSTARIATMIQWVGCSENGNRVPSEVESSSSYHLLIPRWADRLEAVGRIGVVRCYQYNQERGRPLCSESSPRATSMEEVYRLATPDRFRAYMTNGGKSDDMISHYYDKLLHIARPPPEIVRNSYLEEMAEESAKELVEVCIRYGRSGVVDEDYILALQQNLE